MKVTLWLVIMVLTVANILFTFQAVKNLSACPQIYLFWAVL